MIPFGSGSFQLPFQDRTITVFTYKPVTYVHQPLIIIMAGALRNAAEYRDYATNLATKTNCIIAAPLFSLKDYPGLQYSLGNVFPDTAYDFTTLVLSQPTLPNPQSDWTLNIVPDVFSFVRAEVGLESYYLFGHSAGGLFSQVFALFLHWRLPEDLRPRRIISANSSPFCVFPAGPVMKQSAVSIDRDRCYSGPNFELTTSTDPTKRKRHRKLSKRISKEVRSLDNCNANEVTFEVSHTMNEIASNGINKHYNLAENPSALRNRSRFQQRPGPSLPFPYGLGGLLSPPPVEEYLRAPISFYVGDRDVNVYGALNATCEISVPMVHNVPADAQGPFRLFRSLNCFLTGAMLATQQKDFAWRINVANGCGHNGAAVLTIPKTSFVVFGSAEVQVELNREYQKQFVVP